MGFEKPGQIMGLLESIARLCVKYTRRATRKLARSSLMRSGTGRRFLSTRRQDCGEVSFGEGGVWRRGILMGDKCQPLDFSGVIYYDCDGKRVFEPPVKSPRASPFRGYVNPTARD